MTTAVDVTTFHTGPERRFDAILKVMAAVFAREPYPNWTAVGVNWLAGFDFPIKVTARMREREQPCQIPRTETVRWA